MTARMTEFMPTYTQEEFVGRNGSRSRSTDGKHDLWLELLLACTHASTVEDGKAAFMDWTTGDGLGIYASDYDMIAARWDYNYSKRNMGGKASKVGTFNKHLTDAGHMTKSNRGPQRPKKISAEKTPHRRTRPGAVKPSAKSPGSSLRRATCR